MGEKNYCRLGHLVTHMMIVLWALPVLQQQQSLQEHPSTPAAMTALSAICTPGKTTAFGPIQQLVRFQFEGCLSKYGSHRTSGWRL